MKRPSYKMKPRKSLIDDYEDYIDYLEDIIKEQQKKDYETR